MRVNARLEGEYERQMEFLTQATGLGVSEVLKASSWQNYAGNEEVIREGDMDDRFYVLVAGSCLVQRGGRTVGHLGTGDCFGESSYVPGSRRSASVRTAGNVTLLKVAATLLEQASPACQLRFNRVFLKALVSRLQGNDQPLE